MAQATQPSAAGEARPSALGDATIGYSPQRLLSLDVFRGATIILMIIVNNGALGPRYVLAPLEHTAWHGMTPTDWVFPFFLFIMGVAMAFSFSKRLAQAGSRGPLYRKVIIRSAAILAIGWLVWAFLNSFGNDRPFFGGQNSTALEQTFSSDMQYFREHFRYFGVLPRIAWVYLFAGLIVLTFRRWKPIAFISALLLIGYWAIMVFVPFEGKTADPWAYGLTVTNWFDHVRLGGHIRFPAATNPQRGPFGHESLGIISTLPAIVNTLAGYLAGLWLRTGRDPRDKTVGLFLFGFLLVAVASFWAGDLGFHMDPKVHPAQYNIFMPLNKELWTSSYTLYTTGLALLAFAACYWIIDIRGGRRFTQLFVVYGSNAIFVYVGSDVLNKLIRAVEFEAGGETVNPISFLTNDIYAKYATPWAASILWPLTIIAVWWVILTFMYRRKWFLKV